VLAACSHGLRRDHVVDHPAEADLMAAPKPGADRILPDIKDAARFAAWAFTPFQPLVARDLYGLLTTRAFTEEGLYLNLGYWKHARTIDQACAALAMQVAEAARMAPGDDVVDVGFGFADQDMLWIERLAPRHITGLNVTPVQVRLARQRVRRRGMADRMTLIEGSATAMPLPDACCDIVTAVECAFHFHTREDFVAEAFRVLRPGGRLVMADIIRAAPEPDGFRRQVQNATWRQFAEKFAVPAANADQRAPYTAKLRSVGFDNVEVRPIGEHVFPGWHQALRDDRALFARLPLAGRLAYRLLLNFDARTVYAALDYVLATARKPMHEGEPNGAV
jgi:ubiquinone/menaquinone biosynthesis C-methylase UbiE